MGVMAITKSGAPIYNPLSQLNGSLASYYEWTTLDPCYGHTDADYQYHYHAVILYRKSAFVKAVKSIISYLFAHGESIVQENSDKCAKKYLPPISM
jgi:hypothetical protein